MKLNIGDHIFRIVEFMQPSPVLLEYEIVAVGKDIHPDGWEIGIKLINNPSGSIDYWSEWAIKRNFFSDKESALDVYLILLDEQRKTVEAEAKEQLLIIERKKQWALQKSKGDF